MTALKDRLNLRNIIGAIAGVSLALLLIQYFPLIKAEISYQFKTQEQKQAVAVIGESAENPQRKTITAINPEFGLIIPKLGINITVIPEVNPNDSKEYQKALAQGVAHARGTSTPDNQKNTVLFAHSTDNFYNANS